MPVKSTVRSVKGYMGLSLSLHFFSSSSFFIFAVHFLYTKIIYKGIYASGSGNEKALGIITFMGISYLVVLASKPNLGLFLY